MIKRTWESPNVKYHVSVRKFEDGAVLVGFWKIAADGNLKDIRYRNLPQYVKDKIDELKQEVKEWPI
ncbi:hypothetical protein [Oceanobacillus salinisoli]|uniref:hypothetical protein n=1 Tax=Oceanobacillus salinisoli TaxID=2678611 RepID=UPI0012E17307|nr:hypothetical protein [Oceanobacillus salinisoli]